MKKRTLVLVLASFVLANLAVAASIYTGGGKKKESKSGFAKLDLKTSLSFRNGYQFKGGLSFGNHQQSQSLVMHNNAVRFQKGNNLYVLPYKSSSFVHKFKVPKKEIQ